MYVCSMFTTFCSMNVQESDHSQEVLVDVKLALEFILIRTGCENVV